MKFIVPIIMIIAFLAVALYIARNPKVSTSVAPPAAGGSGDPLPPAGGKSSDGQQAQS